MFQVFLIIIQLIKFENLRQELLMFPPCDRTKKTRKDQKTEKMKRAHINRANSKKYQRLQVMQRFKK